MSYTDSDRFKKWVRKFHSGIDHIYELGAPNSGDDVEHMQFRNEYIAMLKRYVAVLEAPDDWLDSEVTKERAS